MTVKELMDALSKYPGDWKVVIDDYDFGYDQVDYVRPGRFHEAKAYGGAISTFEFKDEGADGKADVTPNAVALV